MDAKDFQRDLELLNDPTLPPERREHLVKAHMYFAVSHITALKVSGQVNIQMSVDALLQIQKEVQDVLEELG